MVSHNVRVKSEVMGTEYKYTTVDFGIRKEDYGQGQ